MTSKPKPEPPESVAGKTPGGKKKLLIPLILLLVLGGAGAGGWFSGFIPKLLGKDGSEPGAEHAAAEHAPAHGAEAHGGAHGAAHGAEGHGAHAAEAHGEKKPAVAAVPGAPIFMDLPDIVANLNTNGRRPTYVKLKAKLELSKSDDQAVLTAAMPRVLDLFQGYLREMRPEELRGTAGTYRLREELLARTNLAAPPVRVTAVLFTEMIVQ